MDYIFSKTSNKPIVKHLHNYYFYLWRLLQPSVKENSLYPLILLYDWAVSGLAEVKKPQRGLCHSITMYLLLVLTKDVFQTPMLYSCDRSSFDFFLFTFSLINIWSFVKQLKTGVILSFNARVFWHFWNAEGRSYSRNGCFSFRYVLTPTQKHFSRAANCKWMSFSDVCKFEWAPTWHDVKVVG